MNISEKHLIIERIDQDLQDPVKSVCLQILCFLLSEDASNLKHITFKTIITGTKIDLSSEKSNLYLIKATDYLSSNKLHLLNMQFQFIENDDSDPIHIENDDISLALDSGEFYHPETGILLENFNNFIYPYFTPTEKLERLHG